MYVCMYVCMYMRTYICIYVCMYVCMYVDNTYIHTYIHIYIHVTMYMFMYLYVLANTHRNSVNKIIIASLFIIFSCMTEWVSMILVMYIYSKSLTLLFFLIFLLWKLKAVFIFDFSICFTLSLWFLLCSLTFDCNVHMKVIYRCTYNHYNVYCIYVCKYVCMYALCIHIYVCMHVCMHASMYACMYVCMHVCMHACM